MNISSNLYVLELHELSHSATAWLNHFFLPLSSVAVSQTLAQTSTPTALQKKGRCTRLGVPRSFSLTASSPATPRCPPTLSWVTASMTCASTMECRWRFVTTWRRTLRPVKVQGSPSAGGTTPSAVSDRSLTHRLSTFILFLIYSPSSLQPCPVLLTATTQTALPPVPLPAPTSSPSSATSLPPPVWRAASVTVVTCSVTTSVFLSANVAVWTKSTTTWVNLFFIRDSNTERATFWRACACVCACAAGGRLVADRYMCWAMYL